MDLGIAGRACVVTGGSGGVGLETARMLRSAGAKVLLVGRDGGRLAEAAEGLEGGDEEVVTLPLDVTEPDAGEQMLAAALEAFGGVDVLVNNAGAGHRRDALEAPDSAWRDRYELDVMAPLRAMKAIAPVLAERGWGRIVNVCPTGGEAASQALPRPLSDSSVTTAAERSLSRLFADRYVAAGVLVNAVCPDRPAGAAQIAAEIVFLCSERASYVAGAAWSVDTCTARVIV